MDKSTVKASQQSHDSRASITADSVDTETTANGVTSDATTSPAGERPPATGDIVMTSEAPDGGYGWVIVVACFVLQGMLDGTFSVVGVLLPQFVDYFGGGRAQAAMIGSVMAGCVMLSGPIVSILVNAFGCRAVTMIGGVIVMAGTLMSAFAPSINFIVMSLGFVTGIGLGMTFLPSMVIVGFYFERRRSLATGIATAGAGCGVLVLSYLAGALLQHFDWRGSLMIISGILFNSVVAGALFRPLTSQTPATEESVDEQSMTKANGVVKVQTKDNMTSQTLLKAALLNSTVKSNDRFSDTRMIKDSAVNSTQCEKRNSDEHTAHNVIVSCDSMPRYKSRDTNRGYTDKSNQHRKRGQPEVNQHSIEGQHYYSTYEIHHSSSPATDSLLKHKHCAYPHRKNSPLLQRKDIFYSGSITHLAEFRSQPDMQHYLSSVVIPADDNPADSASTCCDCIPAPYMTTCQRMVDVSLCTNPTLLILALGNAFFQAGFMIPLLFVTDYCIYRGMDPQLSSLFVGVFGVLMVFGRFLGGVVGNVLPVKPIFVVLVAQICAGLAAMAITLCSSTLTLGLCIATVGFMLGPLTPLTTVCLVDYLGLGNLTNAVGLVSLSKGVFCFFGAPIAGALLDVTGSYVAPFAFAGVLYICCGACYAVLPCIAKRV